MAAGLSVLSQYLVITFILLTVMYDSIFMSKQILPLTAYDNRYNVTTSDVLFAANLQNCRMSHIRYKGTRQFSKIAANYTTNQTDHLQISPSPAVDKPWKIPKNKCFLEN